MRRRSGLTGTDEGDDLAAVDDSDAGDDLPVERVQAQGWIGPDGICDRVEEVFEPRRNARPGPVEKREECVAERADQRWLGHTASETVAMIAPAMAAAKPLRKASLVNTRETNEVEADSDIG
jgi:hypothetical protein